MSSDRLSGRVESHDAAMQATPIRRLASAKESLSSSPSVPTRVTAASVRRLSTQLVPVDYCVIETLATVRMATGKQLRRLYWEDSDTGKRLARHHLSKLTKLRLIARMDRRVGGVRAGSDGYTYTLDVAGHRVAADHDSTTRIRRPFTPGERFVAHGLAIADRYVQLSELEADHKFELVTFQSEPDSWRQFTGEHGRTLTVKPDAFVILANDDWEHRWFLEVDRATEHRPAIVRKANDYLTYWRSGTEQRINDIFPKVLWIAPTDGRRDQLLTWLLATDADAAVVFDVCTDDGFRATVLDETGDTVDER